MSGTSRSKPKIVLFSAFYEPFMSGAEQMVKEILEHLGSEYEMTLVTARIQKDLPKKEYRDTFTLVRVGFGSRFDKYLYPFLAPFAAKKLHPQVVHAILESYAGIALMFLRFVLPSAKRILTLQSGGLDHEDKQKNIFLRMFWRGIHVNPHKVTAISRFLASRGSSFRKDMVTITPNGLDFSDVPGDTESIPGRIICVGRLSWVKGHKYLLEAWPQILRQFPGAQLVLVGEGEERKNIERQIENLHIEKSVKLLGNLPHKQVLEEMSKSEIFICPSLAEGLGIVFIEAQACGVPVIGTRVGGIPDIIEDGKTGLLIEEKNSKEIEEAVFQLLHDESLRKRFIENAKNTVKSFEWKNILKDIKNIYEDSL